MTRKPRMSRLALTLLPVGAASLAIGATMMDEGRKDPPGVEVVPGGQDARRMFRDAFRAAVATSAMGAPLANGRSVLYPANWRPMDVNDGTRIQTATGFDQFLHDFSYAGYGRGQIDHQIPATTGNVSLLVDAPGGGTIDDTAKIQSKIDQACAAGGGVVSLRAGTYRVRPPVVNGVKKGEAISIACSRIILRGVADGNAYPSRIVNTDPDMRERAVIRIQPAGGSPTGWYSNVVGPAVALARDEPRPTRIVKLERNPDIDFDVGQTIALRTDITDAFRTEHGVANDPGPGQTTGYWRDAGFIGLLYLRRIERIDPVANTITLDTPTRYPLKTRDLARVHRTAPNVVVVGVEEVALGMVQNDRPGTGTEDYVEDPANVNKGAYHMHGSALIFVAQAEGVWVRKVASFAPSGNRPEVHMLSKGITLTRSTRNVTVERVSFANPQYRGGGGNGYLFSVSGMDNLVKDTSARNGRHNYVLLSPNASGNVFQRCRSVQEGTTIDRSRLPSDTHQYLSHANLFDGCTLDGDSFESTDRAQSSNGAGVTASQNVYWNTEGLRGPITTYRSALIETAQFGYGYVIGTKGAKSNVFAADNGDVIGGWTTMQHLRPVDFVEGEGQGAGLTPQSLFDDQVAKRRSRGACTTC